MSDQGTPPVPETVQEGTDVFISYSRKDIEFVRWLNEQFQEAERQPWIDWKGINPSEEWWLAILRGIDAANTFVFVLSPDSAASDTCRKEIDRSVSSGKRIVPVVCRSVEGVEVHPDLAKLNYIFLCTDAEREDGLGKLFAALDTDFDHVRAHTKFL
ncbi:MAG: toll/interleukin-1 receptor domain-containing protein, partial [Verrucomicrobiales bacterium]